MQSEVTQQLKRMNATSFPGQTDTLEEAPKPLQENVMSLKKVTEEFKHKCIDCHDLSCVIMMRMRNEDDHLRVIHTKLMKEMSSSVLADLNNILKTDDEEKTGAFGDCKEEYEDLFKISGIDQGRFFNKIQGKLRTKLEAEFVPETPEEKAPEKEREEKALEKEEKTAGKKKRKVSWLDQKEDPSYEDMLCKGGAVTALTKGEEEEQYKRERSLFTYLKVGDSDAVKRQKLQSLIFPVDGGTLCNAALCSNNKWTMMNLLHTAHKLRKVYTAQLEACNNFMDTVIEMGKQPDHVYHKTFEAYELLYRGGSAFGA